MVSLSTEIASKARQRIISCLRQMRALAVMEAGCVGLLSIVSCNHFL